MNILWRGAAALSLAIAGLGAVAPAQAQHYGRDGWRDGRDYRGDHRRWDNDRRWDGRRHWRDDRRYHRSHHRGYRQRCWNEWRYDHYRDRRVKVRICR